MHINVTFMIQSIAYIIVINRVRVSHVRFLLTLTLRVVRRRSHFSRGSLGTNAVIEVNESETAASGIAWSCLRTYIKNSLFYQRAVQH